MSTLTALKDMPFREKSAWAMALITAAGAVFYFQDVVSVSRTMGETAPPDFGFVIAYVIFVAIASAIIVGTLASLAGKEAGAPADEREQVISNKAGNWAGYVLAAPAVGALFHYMVNEDGNMLFHLVFLGLMLSQIAEYVFQIFLYRRGA